MYEPTNDPLPWVTERMEKAGVFGTVVDYPGTSNERVRVSNGAAAALLDVLTQTVSALHDDDRAYTVILSKASASAGTLLEKKIVEVGSKPMNDKDLTDGQRAAVMAGLALHEVGHIRYARGYTAAINREFPGGVTGAIGALSNLAADCHDEAAAMRAFPGLAPAIAVTLWWVGDKGKGAKTSASKGLNHSVQQRVNLAIGAARYPWQIEWDSAEAIAYRDWWVEWAGRAAVAGEPKDHAKIVREGIEKIRDWTPTPDEKPEPPPDEPGGDPGTGGQDRGDDEQPGQPGGDEGGDEGGDDEGGDTPGGDGDDEGGDEPTDDEGKGKGEPTDEGGDEPAQPADQPPTDEGQPVDQGGLGSDQKDPDYDPNARDENLPVNDTCPKSAAQDYTQDTFLQSAAEQVLRGKREGMRRRHYNHSNSMWKDYGGRTVIAVPRKGKRWIYTP